MIKVRNGQPGPLPGIIEGTHNRPRMDGTKVPPTPCGYPLKRHGWGVHLLEEGDG